MPDLLDAPPSQTVARPLRGTARREPAQSRTIPQEAVAQVAPRPLRVSVKMYHDMIGAGVFDGIEGRRIELLDEELIEMPAAYAPHEFHVDAAADAFRSAIPSGWSVREEKGVTMARSEPEPDVAVLNKAKKFFRTRKPRPDEVLLVVEVSDSSLHHDRTRKAAIYAAAGVSPYWIVNLPERVLEVRTDPRVGAGGVAEYPEPTVYRAGEVVEFVLAGRSFSLPVAELLPDAEEEDVNDLGEER